MIKLSNPIIETEEIDAIVKVLKTKQLTQGPKVLELEREFAKIVGSRYAVATNSGTSALHTALFALGLGPGDEVITTPFTFVATANAILMTGARPVFVDIDKDTFNIDPTLIEEKITSKTKAILPVDLYGQPADYENINKIAKKYNLFVVEDAAQSIGARYFGKKTGSLADIACFSLYATKNIIAGEGGLITTNNHELDKSMRLFRSHGQDEKNKYNYLGLGYNYRMTDISAALAITQVKKLESLTDRRRVIAQMYDSEFSRVKGIITPKINKESSSVYHQYTIRILNGKRSKFKNYLMNCGIETMIYYPKALYSFEHLKFNYNPRDFVITERATNEVLSIPVHPLLTKEEIYYIIDKVKSYGK